MNFKLFGFPWQDFELTIYDPNGSSTSKNVTCNNDLCPHYYGCTGESSQCPYSVSYVSSETSTSGILVEDVLHLRTEDGDLEYIKPYITFGWVFKFYVFSLMWCFELHVVYSALSIEIYGSDSSFFSNIWLCSCGRVQTGSFLDIAAPNGLFGLGFEKISVPSILSREGYIANSFSMCFGHDGTGRISFGDKGSPDQEETPFNMNLYQWVWIF